MCICQIFLAEYSGQVSVVYLYKWGEGSFGHSAFISFLYTRDFDLLGDLKRDRTNIGISCISIRIL